jgi:hypothetical protein
LIFCFIYLKFSFENKITRSIFNPSAADLGHLRVVD